jgi:hypothetical protein
MAEFIEESVDSTDEPEQEVEQESQAVETNEEENLPEKYKGKDYKEIVRMHQEAEKLIGRQGSEVGELRRIVDDFIKAQASSKQQAQPEVDEEDFFADPKKAVERAIESHPKIKQAEKMASDMTKARALETLKSKHPDFGNVVSDPGFLNWIQASKVRTELFVRADRQYDYDAADELLSLYKDRQQSAKNTVSAEKSARSQQVRAATTTVSAGSDEAPSKKIFRRQDIIRLIQTDPDKYDSMQDEIMAAYRENRVK